MNRYMNFPFLLNLRKRLRRGIVAESAILGVEILQI